MRLPARRVVWCWASAPINWVINEWSTTADGRRWKPSSQVVLCWVRRVKRARVRLEEISNIYLCQVFVWSGLAQYKTTWNENLLYISRALNGLWTCFHYRVLFAFRAFFSSLITSDVLISALARMGWVMCATIGNIILKMRFRWRDTKKKVQH